MKRVGLAPYDFRPTTGYSNMVWSVPTTAKKARIATRRPGDAPHPR
ncbi:hypothetical protein [Dactylosporangium sp. NPDC006015]